MRQLILVCMPLLLFSCKATKDAQNQALVNQQKVEQAETELTGMKHVTDSQLAFILREVADVVGDDDMKISRWAFGRHIKKEGAKYLSSISLTLVKGGEDEVRLGCVHARSFVELFP